jgi:adenine-specific DNA-methyltransferase
MKKLTDQDPQTKSPNLAAENIEQLKALFPEAVTEGKIDFDVLKQLLGGAVDGRAVRHSRSGTAGAGHRRLAQGTGPGR